MDGLKSVSIALLLTLTAGSSVLASEIYKWTDEDGNVHYGDRPTGANSEERLAIRSRPTDPARVQAQVQARLDSQQARAEQAAAEPAGPTPEELAAEARERSAKCEIYKERLTSFVQSRHLYRLDEGGERIYLNEDEMQKARQKVQDQVEEYCD